MKTENNDIYPIGLFISGLLTFIVSWIYCIIEYGYLLGVGLGWLPSIIVAAIVGFLWPLFLIAVIFVGWIFLKNM